MGVIILRIIEYEPSTDWTDQSNVPLKALFVIRLVTSPKGIGNIAIWIQYT